MDIKLYVIIVTYNAMKWIDRCLSSVITSTIKSKIVVIDNNSTDNSVEYIKENFNEVIILPNNKNLGFGKANNLGIKYALVYQKNGSLSSAKGKTAAKAYFTANLRFQTKKRFYQCAFS